jgi:hypothetical protein
MLLFSNLIDINKSYNDSYTATVYCCHPIGRTSTVMHAVHITNPLICGDGAQDIHALRLNQQVPYSLNPRYNSSSELEESSTYFYTRTSKINFSIIFPSLPRSSK